MTGIEWADFTWNPVTGCSPASEGCEHCYARVMARRMANIENVNHRERYAGFKPTCWPERLAEPMSKRKPSIIFVASMGDMFHPDIPFDFMDRVFAVMALCPRHSFVMLTKRPERMGAYIADAQNRDGVDGAVVNLVGDERGEGVPTVDDWPLPNVWLGTSCENQQTADERIPHILKLGSKGWNTVVSLEPLLGPVDLTAIQPRLCDDLDCLRGGWHAGNHNIYEDANASIDWVILGGETGPGARPMDPDWARSVRDQCKDAGVPFFMKKMSGGAEPPPDLLVRQWPKEMIKC